MDIKRNTSITEATIDVNLNDPPGLETIRKQGENAAGLATQHAETHFQPRRIFINHIDSYSGKILANLLSNTVDLQGRHVDSTSNVEAEKVAVEEDDDYTQETQRDKRRQPDKGRTEVSKRYNVIGTVLDHKYQCPEEVKLIIRKSDNEDRYFLSELMDCDVIIYDITQKSSQIEEARWVLKEIIRKLEDTKQQKSPEAFKLEEPIRYFILISTVMTWALTKPLDPEDPDLPFTEADYRKRKSHPNYKEHIQCERDVVTVKKLVNLKNKLRTLVVCCGIMYGEEEGPLHYLFKMAWKNASFLPVFGEGRNRIPLLHVRDLAAIISSVLQNWPSMRYIVAVEQELISQRMIVKRISQGLTTGKIKTISKEEALLLPEVSQKIYHEMTVDLNIDPVYIIDRIRWHFEVPFQDAIEAIIKEYKVARNLYPVKIIVLGPPASGKTIIARYLADYYGIHYIHVKSLISETIQNLIDKIEVARSIGDQKDSLEDDKKTNAKLEEDTEEEDISNIEQQLDEIRDNMAVNNGRLDDTVLTKLFMNRLKSKDCSNQGYVMDGHPKTLEQAKKLFLLNSKDLEEDEDEERKDETFEDEDIELRNANVAILPELVIVLDASDEILKERIINQPEIQIQNTHYTEEHMLRRMREYRERNTDDNTPLQLFDEMEIHPFIISVEFDICPDMLPTIHQCLEKLGKPRNYGPTAEEIEAAQKRLEAETRAAQAAKNFQKEREFLECKRQREEKMMEWTNLMEKLKQEEEERLCILAEPLRHYLMKYVFPTLTEALIEVAKLRPEDPIDFLAEYLFKKNPEGRMFEPDYTETMSMLLDAIARQQNDILPGESLEADVMQFLKRRDELSIASGIGKGKEENVCGEVSTMSITAQTSVYETANDFKEEESSFSDRLINKNENQI